MAAVWAYKSLSARYGRPREILMAKIFNLTHARKMRARAEKRKAANTNAAKYGQSKTERRECSAEITKLNRHLDEHERE